MLSLGPILGETISCNKTSEQFSDKELIDAVGGLGFTSVENFVSSMFVSFAIFLVIHSTMTF